MTIRRRGLDPGAGERLKAQLELKGRLIAEESRRIGGAVNGGLTTFAHEVDRSGAGTIEGDALGPGGDGKRSKAAKAASVPYSRSYLRPGNAARRRGKHSRSMTSTAVQKRTAEGNGCHVDFDVWVAKQAPPGANHREWESSKRASCRKAWDKGIIGSLKTAGNKTLRYRPPGW